MHSHLPLVDTHPLDALPPHMQSASKQSQQVLASSTLPRKFDSFADPAAPLPELPATDVYKDGSAAAQFVDLGNSQNTPNASPFTKHVGHQSPILPFDLRRELVSSRGYYPMGISPSMHIPGASNNFRGFSIVNMMPGYRESVSGGLPLPESYGRLRTDSISLPPPFSKPSDGDMSNPLNNFKSSSWGNEPLRSTSIFSSLIQMPPSNSNSVSGQSSKDSNRLLVQLDGKKSLVGHSDYDLGPRDNFHSFNWPGDHKPSVSSVLGSRRGTKAFENTIAVWDQLNRGMSGSVAGFNADNMNHFLASMQNSGSVDLTGMRGEQHHDSMVKPTPDASVRPQTSYPGTSLREDIFDEKPIGSVKHSRKASASGDKPMSPTSSLSSKTSKRTFEEVHSPKAPPLKVQPISNTSPYAPAQSVEIFGPNTLENATGGMKKLPGRNTVKIEDHQDPLHKHPEYFPTQRFNRGMTPETHYSPFLQGPDGAPLNQAGIGLPEDDKQLVSVQQYARSEDGRPLLGATKVDQLMLVIQAREKGNTAAIKQAPDGTILASPNQSQGANSVLPLPSDLVGGVSKPVKQDPEAGDKKRKKGKTQHCPYCLRTFNQATHLDVHVRSHIGYKPFQCSVCLKRFTQGGNLRTHMRLHTGEKPFLCNVCDRSFSRKGNLAAHMLTHNKEKPFECKLDNCDKLFTQLGNLKSHQNKFHLPTLTKLTQSLANLTGNALAKLPPEEKELLDYFAKLYKNSNKGIRGRGKASGLKINDNAEQQGSINGSAHSSPTGINQRFNDMGAPYNNA